MLVLYYILLTISNLVLSVMNSWAYKESHWINLFIADGLLSDFLLLK